MSATSTSLCPVDSAAESASSSSSSSAELVPLTTCESAMRRHRLESERRAGRCVMEPMPESVVLRLRSAIATVPTTSRFDASAVGAVDDKVSASPLNEPQQRCRIHLETRRSKNPTGKKDQHTLYNVNNRTEIITVTLLYYSDDILIVYITVILCLFTGCYKCCLTTFPTRFAHDVSIMCYCHCSA